MSGPHAELAWNTSVTQDRHNVYSHPAGGQYTIVQAYAGLLAHATYTMVRLNVLIFFLANRHILWACDLYSEAIYSIVRKIWQTSIAVELLSTRSADD